MFPLTHIWFSRRVLGYSNNMTVLGSVFPDTVIKCCLTYDQTHKTGRVFFEYFNKYAEEYLDFARAVVTHTVDPRGLDFYGDEEFGSGYKGYCFQKAAEIEKEVIEACNIPDRFGLWKAHNFIEMGIEMNMAYSESKLVDIYQSGLSDKGLIHKLSFHIDKYFGLKESTAEECFSKFSGYMKLSDLSSLAFAERYNKQMQLKHGISIDIKRCSSIIEKSRILVQEDYCTFMDYCTEKVKLMLKEEFA